MMRGKRRPEYLYLSLLTAAVGIVVTVLMCIMMISSGNPLLSRKDAEGLEIIHRAEALAGGESVAENRISAGMYSVSDYLISVFESPEYLTKCDSDEMFAADLARVAYGEYEDKDVTYIMGLLEGDTRQNTISTVMKSIKSSYKATMKVPKGEGTGVANVNITEDFSRDGRVLMGINTASGTMDYTRDDIRADIFIDGAVCHGFLTFDGSDDSGMRKFNISWDTSQARPGNHEISIIFRTADGRSRSFPAGRIDIPEFEDLANDRAYDGILPASRGVSWYRFNCEDRDCYVNFVGVSDDIRVDLFDLFGNKIGSNDLEGKQNEVLRGKAQDIGEAVRITGINGISNCFYIRVQKGELSSGSEDITYMMIGSPEVAYYNGTYMAVIPQEDGKYRLVDKDLELYEDEAKNIKFLPINGALCALSVTDVTKGEAIELWPGFESQTKEYAYYIEEETRLKVSCISQEGYAAEVTVSSDRSSGSGDYTGCEFDIEQGFNTITFRIDSFTGEQSEYKIYILCGDDDRNFRSTLEDFPKSYYSGLILLHIQYPDYVFTAYDTGLDFEDVVDVQDSGGRSLATYTYNPSYVKPDSRIYDAPDWMAVKPEVIRYYLDPRNFLRIERIFMFERQSFNPQYHTIEGVRSMIAGSFMDTDEFDYAQAIYNAAGQSGVSPYLLASRILQEMGFYGQSDLATGTVSGYEGYYNYYNIGSYASTSQGGPVLNGARYARWGNDPDAQEITEREEQYLLPWDSIDKAITGGALWIANGYINNGQDTLYFQKFDVVDNGTGLYDHQYAGFIMMAYSEGYRYYKSYKETDQLGNSFEFIIPIYDNMPEEYGYLP